MEDIIKYQMQVCWVLTLWSSNMVSPRDEQSKSSETTRKSPVFNKTHESRKSLITARKRDREKNGIQKQIMVLRRRRCTTAFDENGGEANSVLGRQADRPLCADLSLVVDGLCAGEQRLESIQGGGARSDMQQYVSVQEYTQWQGREAGTNKTTRASQQWACAGMHENVGNAPWHDTVRERT